MDICREPCDNSCEALQGLYEKTVNLIAYSNLINAWVNGPANGTVNIAGVNTPTLLNFTQTLRNNATTLLTTFEANSNAKLAAFQTQINTIPTSIILPGGGINVDANGKLFIDFNDMPDDRFYEILKSLRLPIWLSGNKDFYVNTATGTDTLDTSRGEIATKPFKTIQACVNYVANNFNIGNYRARILVYPGTYNEALTLPSYSRNSGYILITSQSGNQDNTIINNTTHRSSAIQCTGGKWEVSNLSIFQSPDMAQMPGTNTANVSLALSYGKNSELHVTGNKYKFAPTNGSPGLRYVMYCLRALDGGTLWIDAGDTINTITVTDKPEQVEVYIIQGAAQGLLRANGTADPEKKPGLLLNADYDICAYADSGQIIYTSSYAHPPVISNLKTASGKRYRCTSGGSINTGGGGATFFPGSIDGTVESSTFSWYK